MITLIVRKFTVNVPLQQAWDHLARIEEWPSWAPHIKQVELRPPGELGPQSTGIIHLAGGLKPPFRMTEFHPPRDSGSRLPNWKWVGPFLWATVIYDHQFEALDAGHTKLIWIVAAEGVGANIIGPLFAMIYRRNLEKAIPRLVREMNAEAGSN